MSNEVMTRNSEWMNHIVNHLNQGVSGDLYLHHHFRGAVDPAVQDPVWPAAALLR